MSGMVFSWLRCDVVLAPPRRACRTAYSMRALALCLLLAAAPAAAQTFPVTEIFPLQHQQSAAREIVRFRVALAHCPAAAPGPRARVLWKLVKQGYRVSPPNEAAIKAWIESETAKSLQSPPIGSADYRCEQAKALYGEFGRKVRNAIVMRNGSSTVRRCVLDGSCSSADTIDVWLY